MGKVLMVQGTASHVGKSVLVSALCRIFRQDGFRVAPFKAQNMSNNSYVTPDGGEIGRAQAVQAQASGVEPQVEMNPILLKPEADQRSQVVRMGRPWLSARAMDYYSMKSELWESVKTSLDTLRRQFDVVVIEGAGSPAEINLKATEIVNMRVAMYANAPVLLCGDIDRGGVFASIVGTLELLEPEERKLIKGLIINKFRGDIALLTDGLTWLEQRTGKPVAGVVHHFRDIHIPEEDSVALEIPESPQHPHLPKGRQGGIALDVAVVRLPHISNFDDFDPLDREPGVSLRYVDSLENFGSPDLIILPGTKTTIPDLAWMEDGGLTGLVKQAHQRGAAIVGICGGYQMIGTHLSDPDHVESPLTEMAGLGLLPTSTVFAGSKETHRVKGAVSLDRGLLQDAKGLPVQGYEIHMGRTISARPRPDSASVGGAGTPFQIHDRVDVPVTSGNDTDGCLDASGWVMGTYIHGLFHNGELRRSLLQSLARRKGVRLPDSADDVGLDREYDKLADWVRSSLNMDLVYEMTGLVRDFDSIGAVR